MHLRRAIDSQDKMLLKQQLQGKVQNIPRQFCSSILHGADLSFNKFDSSFNSRVNWIDLEKIENRFLLSAYGNGGISIFDLYKPFKEGLYRNAAVIDRTNSGRHKMSVECVQWYPHDTGIFMSLSADQTMQVWDANELQVAYKFEFQQKVSNFDISPSQHHSLVSVTSNDCNLYLCDLKSGSKNHTVKGHQSSSLLTKWSPRNQNLLVSTSVSGEVYIWDVRKSNSLLMKLSNGAKGAHDGAVNGICFTQDGLYLITYSTDKTVGLWDLSTGTQVKTSYGYVANEFRRPVRLSVTSSLVDDVMFIPSQEKVKVFEIHTGKCTKIFSAHLMEATSCEFNNDAMVLYSGSADTKILEWSCQDRQQVLQSNFDDFN